MRFLLIVVISLFSGIFAGMGMGGGTFLIPLLYIFFGTEQVILQSTNIISFLGISIICFVIYVRSKLIDFRSLVFVAVPAAVISAVGAIFSLKISSNLLHLIFAIFIIIIGVVSFFRVILRSRASRI